MRKVLSKNVSLVFLVIIMSLSLLTWRFIPKLQFIGEGFQYFGVWNLGGAFTPPLKHDIFARIFFTFVPNYFKDRVELYMVLMLLIMLLTDLLFFWVVKIMTDAKTAFVASLIFSLSLAGKYDMYASGGYQYFVQRGVPLGFLLVSSMFLVLYLKEHKSRLRYIVLSQFFFVTSILTGFFATWFTPFLFFYPVVVGVVRKKLKYLLVGVSFIVVNYLMIAGNGFIPGEPISYYLSLIVKYIDALSLQMAVVTFPPGTHKLLLKIFGSNFVVGLLTSFFYLFAIWLLRREKKKFEIAIAAFLGLVSVLILNLYLNMAAVESTTDSSRYFYYPMAMVAIFWAMFLSFMLQSTNKMKILSVALLAFFVIRNYQAVQSFNKSRMRIHELNRETLSIVKNWSNDLKKEPAYVYLPTSLGPYGVGFALRFYSHPEGQFFEERLHPLDFDELVHLDVDPERLYVLHYDPQSETIVDKTNESRMKLRTIFASKFPSF